MHLSIFHNLNVLLVMYDNAKRYCTIYQSRPAGEIIREVATEVFNRSEFYTNNDVRRVFPLIVPTIRFVEAKPH